MVFRKYKFNLRTSKGIFEVIFESNDEEKGYTVIVPSLPEIVTEGKTLDDAKKMAREAIELAIECRIKDGESYEYCSDLKSQGSRTVPVKVRV
ncbi:MAG: type II toxin-antitoxin system HicB family antitoxin [Parcubacteria group bacterium]|nr:type II toxin-antitoxin system HicB family antitoxin [Parcubacteria group bacterium]